MPIRLGAKKRKIFLVLFFATVLLLYNCRFKFLKKCSNHNENLIGPVYANISLLNILDVEKELIVNKKLNIHYGGVSYNNDCYSPEKNAIIIPYRNRLSQLNTFLNHMHPILTRQQNNYRIFVVEQVGNSTFNRAMLFNIGFIESLKHDSFDCFIFHDVDLLLENDNNIYDCKNAPSHLSVAVDKFDYKIPYPEIFGGIEVFKKEQFLKINGFSNLFWGWGGEDDDLYTRTIAKGYIIHRPPESVARYKMNQYKHTTDYFMTKEKTRPLSMKTIQEADGLNSITYPPIREISYRLYTLLMVNI